MTQAKKRWSYSVGERGRNRVRLFEHPVTRSLFLEVYDAGRRQRVALKHRDRELGKAKAEELATKLRRGTPVLGAELTLQVLFDNYLREVTPTKSPNTQQKDRQVARLFVDMFGGDRKVATLSRREWDAFIQRRRQGSDGRPGRVTGKPVRNRVIAQNLKTVMAAINWAMTMGDGQGGYMLDRNPFKGLPIPIEASPRRPMLSQSQYSTILEGAVAISPLFECALVIAHETGHRIGSIRLLRWSDVDLEGGRVRWRGENDKIGFEHSTPLTDNAIEAFRRARAFGQAIGEAWVFPSPEDHSVPASRHLMRDWWQRGEVLAGIVHQPGLGWHSLRRKFATELKATPLKDLCQLGGWKEPQTVLKSYQQPDDWTMRSALLTRKPVSVGGG